MGTRNKEGKESVTPDLCSARFMLHCEPEVGWVSWRSIWSCCQFSYSCIWASVVCGLAADSDSVHQADNRLPSMSTNKDTPVCACFWLRRVPVWHYSH